MGRMNSPIGLPYEVVEVAVLGPGDERRDLPLGVDQYRAVGIPGVADGDARPAGQLGQLHAVAAGVATGALAPGESWQLGRGHAVADLMHRCPFMRTYRSAEPRHSPTCGRTRPHADAPCVCTCICS